MAKIKNKLLNPTKTTPFAIEKSSSNWKLPAKAKIKYKVLNPKKTTIIPAEEWSPCTSFREKQREL